MCENELTLVGMGGESMVAVWRGSLLQCGVWQGSLDATGCPHKERTWNDMSWTNVDQTLGAIKMGLADYSGYSTLVSSQCIHKVESIETTLETKVH